MVHNPPPPLSTLPIAWVNPPPPHPPQPPHTETHTDGRSYSIKPPRNGTEKEESGKRVDQVVAAPQALADGQITQKLRGRCRSR